MVKEILTLLGHEVNDDELADVMEGLYELWLSFDQKLIEISSEFDEDESGEIEFAEFIKLAEEFVEPEVEYSVMKNELREVFMMYDKERRGYIPTSDFISILKELDNDLPDSEAAEIVKELDSDGSGTIDFEEFVEAMIGEDDEKRWKNKFTTFDIGSDPTIKKN